MKQSLHIPCCLLPLAPQHSSASVPVELPFPDKGLLPLAKTMRNEGQKMTQAFVRQCPISKKANTIRGDLVYFVLLPHPLRPGKKLGLLSSRGLHTWAATCV